MSPDPQWTTPAPGAGPTSSTAEELASQQPAALAEGEAGQAGTTDVEPVGRDDEAAEPIEEPSEAHTASQDVPGRV